MPGTEIVYGDKIVYLLILKKKKMTVVIDCTEKKH